MVGGLGKSESRISFQQSNKEGHPIPHVILVAGVRSLGSTSKIIHTFGLREFMILSASADGKLFTPLSTKSWPRSSKMLLGFKFLGFQKRSKILVSWYVKLRKTSLDSCGSPVSSISVPNYGK
jgi:hypothetical protein